MAKRTKVGTFAGMPYDWRRPTIARFKSRLWNPAAPLMNPRWFGWGYDLNFYALIHPIKWREQRKIQQK